MLGTSTSKNAQNMILGVEAPGLRQRPDRPSHGSVGHFDESQSYIVDGQAFCSLLGVVLVYLYAELLESSFGEVEIQRRIFVWAEDFGEVLRQEPA